MNGRVYFAAADPVHGDELWSTDGTPAGTGLAVDLESWAVRLVPPRPDGLERPALFPRPAVPPEGAELWTSDGTATGTRLVQDIAPGPSWSTPYSLTPADGALYFSANDGAHGRELWVLPASEVQP